MKNRTAAADYTNYITVYDLLYPEHRHVSAPPQEYDDNYVVPTAVVVIDEAANAHVNRWDVVWAEATLLNDTTSPPNGGNGNSDSPVQPNKNSNIETIPVPPQPALLSETTSTGGIDAPVSNSTTNSTSQNNPSDAPYYHGNIIEIIFGLSMTIAAVVGTLLFEIATMIVYIIATVLYEVAKKFQRNHSLCLGFVLHVCAFSFILTAYSIMLVDVSLFICSIIIAEILAITGGIVNVLLSFGERGMIWHQYIRRMCHLTRWAFRDVYPSTEKEPKRTFPYCQRKVQKEPTVSAR